jgi:hypothetical protein
MGALAEMAPVMTRRLKRLHAQTAIFRPPAAE